jgi:ABC-2 type transport system permease protein
VVAHLLRLKLALLRNGLRRNTGQIVALAIGMLYACGAVVLAVAGLIALSTVDAGSIRTVLVLGGSVLVLAWSFLPLVSFGVDATLDPSRFVMFVIPRRDLLTGLALSGLLGVPGVATAVVVGATTLSWWRHPVAALVSLPCTLLALATCVVGSRATTTAMSRMVGRRRFREVMAVVIIIPLMLMGPIISAVSSGVAAGSSSLPAVAAAAGWTPLGAVWAVPADVAAGAWGSAALKALIALATLGALVVWWDRSLSHALVTTTSTGSSTTPSRAQGLGAFDQLPATPTGAIVARCLTYWVRDPRYAAAVLVVPAMPVLLYFSGGGGGAVMFSAPLVGLLMGWAVSADVARDSTAFWTHVAAPISGRVDRTGRVIAAAMIGLPATLIVVVGSAAVTHRWAAIPALTGASVGLMLTALGLASVLSARFVYPVPRPGESPFGSQQGSSMVASLSSLVGLLAIIVLGLPELALAGFAVGTGSMVFGLIAMVVGLALGATVLIVGIRLGGRTLDRNAPELLAQLVSFG